ncbi:MAG: MFS transporter [Methylococcaceae bacterium]
MQKNSQFVSYFSSEARIIPGFGEFFLYWLATSLALFALTFAGFVIATSHYTQSGSISAYTLIMLATIGPEALLAFFVGPLADRFSPQNIISIALLMMAALILMLSFGFSTFSLTAQCVILGLASAVSAPLYASISVIAADNPEQLAQSSSLIQIGFSVIPFLLAPLIAISWISQSSLMLAFQLDSGLVWLGVCLSLGAGYFYGKPNRATASLPFHHSLQDMLFGVRYIIGSRGLFRLLIMVGLGNLLFGMVESTVLPLMLSVTTLDQVPFANICGILMCLAGGFIASLNPVARRWRPIMPLIIVSMGIGTMACAMSMQFKWVILIYATLLGAFSTLDSLDQYAWQTQTPQAIQGRVLSARQSLIITMFPLGYFLVWLTFDSIFPALQKTLDLWPGLLPKAASTRALWLCAGTLMMGLGLFAYAKARQKKPQPNDT